MAEGDLAGRLRAIFAEELDEQVRAGNEHVLALEKVPGDAEQLRSLFRVMHTLKGAARAAGMPDLEHECHHLEALLASARDESRALSAPELKMLFAGMDVLSAARDELGAPGAPAAARESRPVASASVEETVAETSLDAPIRVNGERVDELFAISNRLLVTAAAVEAYPDGVERLQDAATRASSAWRRLRVSLPKTAGTAATREMASLDALLDGLRKDLAAMLGEALQTGRSLERIAGDVSRGVRGLRMRPFADILGDLPRLVRDLAAATGKDVALETSGETVQADRVVLARLHDAIVHLVRNAVDHGIETPAERLAAGKPERGQIRIGASLIGDRIVVTVEDDGAGIDVVAARRALAARSESVPADDRAVVRRLFLGGISTRAAADTISGRGVGLDAVRAIAERVRGGVDVTWTPGGGSTFTIEAPLTLATVRAVLTRVGGTVVAVPAAFVLRLLRVQPESLRVVEGRLAVESAGAPTMVASLASILGPPLVDRPPDGALLLVLLRVGTRSVALRVDELLEEVEVVVRPIRAHGRVAVQHVSGAAMLASGTVALVLNPTAVIATALGLPADATPIGAKRAEQSVRKRILVVDDSITTRTLEASVLEAAGYDVATAVDGADGWRLLQERGADLVVSDVEMPRMDGLQLTESMRGSPRFRGTPVILVTALETPEHRARGLEVGADAYLGKSSFEQDALLTTIRDLLG